MALDGQPRSFTPQHKTLLSRAPTATVLAQRDKSLSAHDAAPVAFLRSIAYFCYCVQPSEIPHLLASLCAVPSAPAFPKSKNPTCSMAPLPECHRFVLRKCAYCQGGELIQEHSKCPACEGKEEILVLRPPRCCPHCKGVGKSNERAARGAIELVRCMICYGTGWVLTEFHLV